MPSPSRALPCPTLGRMGRTNKPRSIGSRPAARGKRKAGLLWEGEDSEGTRLDH